LFECNITAATGVSIYMRGYFMEEAVFFDDAKSYSGTSNVWTDADISSHTGTDTPTASILSFSNSNIRFWGTRKNGSADNLYNNAEIPCDIVGVDASQISEFKFSIAGTIYLLGYMTDGVVMYDTAIDRSIGSTGAYADLTALPAGAIGGIYTTNGGGGANYSVRAKGASDDIYQGQCQVRASVFVECDSSQLCEMKISDTAVDIWERGYFTESSSRRNPVATVFL